MTDELDPLIAASVSHHESLAAQQAAEAAAARRNDAVRSAFNAGHRVMDIADTLGVDRSRIYKMLEKERP